MDVLKRNHVNVFGNGSQPLLFAHGFGCDQLMWRFITPAFEEDYKIVLFDHIGFGQADNSAYSAAHYASLQAYADDMLEICAALSLRDIVFVGHSVSSMIGMLAAIKAPELFQRLIFISPSPCYLNDGAYKGGLSLEEIEGLLEVLDSNYLKWAGEMAPVIMGNPDRPQLSQELEKSFCQSNQQIARDFARLTFLSDNRTDLANLEVPTLLLQCDEDLIAPLAVGNYMHQHLKQNSLIILKAHGHCPQISAPVETIAAMKTILG